MSRFTIILLWSFSAHAHAKRVAISERVLDKIKDEAEHSQGTRTQGPCCCTPVGECSIAPFTWSLATSLMRKYKGKVYVEPPGPKSRNRCCSMYFWSCPKNETEDFHEQGDPSLCGDGGQKKPGIHGPFEFSVFVQAKMIRQIQWNKYVEGAAFSQFASPMPTTYYQTSLIICPFGSDRRPFEVLQGPAALQLLNRIALRDGMKCVELRYDASQEKAYTQVPGTGFAGIEHLRYAGIAMLSEDTADSPEDAAKAIAAHYLEWSRSCFSKGKYNAMKNNQNHFVYRVLDDMGLDARRSLQEFAPELFEVDPNMFRIISALASNDPWVFGEQDPIMLQLGSPEEPRKDQLKAAWFQEIAPCGD